MMVEAASQELLLSHSIGLDPLNSPDLLQMQLVWVTSVRLVTVGCVLTVDVGSSSLQDCVC